MHFFLKTIMFLLKTEMRKGVSNGTFAPETVGFLESKHPESTLAVRVAIAIDPFQVV